TQCQACMRCCDFHIFVGISNRLSDLIVYTPGRKIGKSARKGDLPAYGQPGSNPHHVGLRNTNLEKALRKLLDKVVHLQRPDKVGTQCYHALVLPPCFQKTSAKT